MKTMRSQRRFRLQSPSPPERDCLIETSPMTFMSKEPAVHAIEMRTPNFIRSIVAEDQKNGKHGGRVATRFPPGPNGYMHIGHAKAISISYGIAQEYHGAFHLRFDDTNPAADDPRYVEAIQNDMHWLGFDWGEHLYFASDYYEALYERAVKLIRLGKAYVCSLNEQQIREFRGTFTEPGRPSPYRNRSVEENLDLFARMRAGEFPDGAHVLRGKIDMAASNIVMRDPIFYRIRHLEHYRTGNKWWIYPLYDFAHCISDAIENITHSICSLEFENNRELYDWILRELNEKNRPQQIEYARLSLTYTVLSKRKLAQLVSTKTVSGWDDPRMPTVAGMRRRGYPASAILDFCDRIGVTRDNSTIEYSQLEFCVRNALNATAPRAMCVLNPVKVVIENYPENKVEDLVCPYYPESMNRPGTRNVPFSRELYIEREDFMENPSNKFFRLAPGKEVRLRHAYIIKCTEVIKDENDEIVMLRCTYDDKTLGTNPIDRKVKGTIHWVSSTHAKAVEVRLYDRLFMSEKPGASDEDFLKDLNPHSLALTTGYAEPAIVDAPLCETIQFERLGYFVFDSRDSSREFPVFNRTVPLRDSSDKGER